MKTVIIIVSIILYAVFVIAIMSAAEKADKQADSYFNNSEPQQNKGKMI